MTRDREANAPKLAVWLHGESGGEPAALSDVARVRAVLIAAARRQQPLGYADLLAALGHRFTRPKMRALCRTLDAIDASAVAAGEPELAVLVVRESDGLPGQGWWTGGPARALGYDGPWTGPEARRFVRELQNLVFDHWSGTARDGVDAGSDEPGSDAQM